MRMWDRCQRGLCSALGFYAVDPVSAKYTLDSPLVERPSVHVGKSKRLEIVVKRLEPSHMYVEAFMLNGVQQ